jgi:Schlafen group 3, DNA/RNA helicase domain
VPGKAVSKTSSALTNATGESSFAFIINPALSSLPATHRSAPGTHGIRNGFNFTKVLREGPWYNDPPDSRLSCCALNDVATEFACQGLELDFPIVAWGSDLTWNGTEWQSPPQPRSQAHDPHRLRLNSYRVLLSRGRDGFVVFVPPEAQMERTYQALTESGLRVL